ncbi:MAG: cell surface protein [Acidovorax sp.]|nr:cell surface protein [Acidovorax sp.]
MKKNVLALSIAAMIGGLGFAGAASADVIVGSGAAAAGAATVNLQQGLLIVPGTPANSRMSVSTATSLSLSEGGVGSMLLVPYYTVQNGNMTVLHVVNTDTLNGKAVKVRFRGAANSDDVMDFQVFMSPGDVWTAAVTAGADGIAQIQSADNTCSVPALGINAPKAFSTGRLNPAASDTVKANGTREGYVEIFNMADIPSDKIYTVGTTANTNSALYTAIKHVTAVAPCSVAGSASETTLFNAALTNFSVEANAANVGFNTPTGGLLGDWYIINVPETTTFSGANTAVRADGGNGRGNFVHFPQIDTAVAAADMLNFTADPLLRGDALKTDGTAFSATGVPALTGGFYDLPDMSTPYLAADIGAPKAQAIALTSALAVTSVTNQYANDESISAKTDWVFSMPTRRYSVAANYKAVTGTTPANDANTSYRLFSNLVAGVLPSAVATAQDEWFFAANTPVSTDDSGNICVKADAQRFYDREETTPGATTPGPVFSPRTPGTVSAVALCGEASVLAFKSTGNSVLASSVARSTITSGTYTNGWGVVTTTNAINNAAAAAANVVQGLPVLGASFIKLSNPQVAAGLSGTYGITWPHRFTK